MSARQRRRRSRNLIAGAAMAGLAVLLAAAFVWRDDILRAFLDPRTPFVVTPAPSAPDYGRASAWALRGGDDETAKAVDVFFIHPTTYAGGDSWNGAIDNRRAAAQIDRIYLPNYAGPFFRSGRVFAPRYRQASLFTAFTLFDDALSARALAYSDVRAAFRLFRDHLSEGRPFILVGVEQGGFLGDRLLQQEVAPYGKVRDRLVAAYLIDTVTPVAAHAVNTQVPACQSAAQAGCVLAWSPVWEGDIVTGPRRLARAVVWDRAGRLIGLQGAEALCVNPLLGRTGDDEASRRLNRGAANATGLEWGLRPAFLPRQVDAQCQEGLLRVSRPSSPSLHPPRNWIARFKAPPYNLFWADIEADADSRIVSWIAGRARPSAGQPQTDGRAPVEQGLKGGESSRTAGFHK